MALPEMAKLEIRQNPRGATVYVDGKYVGEVASVDYRAPNGCARLVLDVPHRNMTSAAAPETVIGGADISTMKAIPTHRSSRLNNLGFVIPAEG